MNCQLSLQEYSRKSKAPTTTPFYMFITELAWGSSKSNDQRWCGVWSPGVIQVSGGKQDHLSYSRLESFRYELIKNDSGFDQLTTCRSSRSSSGIWTRWQSSLSVSNIFLEYVSLFFLFKQFCYQFISGSIALRHDEGRVVCLLKLPDVSKHLCL